MARLNPMAYQAQLEQVLNEGKGSLVIAGELSRHQYLTKEKTDEIALKEQQEANLQTKPTTGYLFSVKNAKVISGAGIGTVMAQIIESGFKPGNDGSTYVECRCGRRMPSLYIQENGGFTDITEEFKEKPLSYQGPIQVCYSLSKGKKDNRIYLNVDGVLFATKPDVFVPEDDGNNGRRDVSSAFAATGFYGQVVAPAQPAGFAQAAPAQPAGFAQAAAPVAQPTAAQPTAAPAQPAAPTFTWPQ